MRQNLKDKNINKKNRKWESFVNYSFDDLKQHLYNTMPKSYTWQDFMNGKLHIDHIIPISVFNYTSPEQIDFQRCWALDNLRLLPAKDNIVKGCKIKEPFQPSLMIG